MSSLSSSATRRRGGIVAAAVALALVFAACGSDSDSAAPADNPTSSESAASGQTVTIETFQFTPKDLKVKVGDTVEWTNNDAILHTVTSGTREYAPGNGGQVTKTDKDGKFDLQLDGKGSKGEYTFTEAGKFHYFCDRHPGMEADIEVS